MNTIYYVSAIAGAGKTRSAIEHVASRATEDKRYIILQPTTRLNEQTRARFVEIGFPEHAVQMVNSLAVDDGESVTGKLHQLLNKPGECVVIIATVEAWVRLKRRTPNRWHLICDEVPAVFSTSVVSSKSIHHRLTEFLAFHDPDQHGERLVTIKRGGQSALLNLIKESRSDRALSDLESTAQSLLKGSKTFVADKSFGSFMNGPGSSLTFYHVMTPRIFAKFASVTIMAANFTESPLHLIWSHYGVRFKERLGFARSQLPTKHPEAIGKSLDIHYLVENWSQKQKTNKAHEAVYVEEFRRMVGEIFAGENFIYTLNGSDNPHLLQGISNGVYVAPRAHGLNEFRSYDNAAIYAVFNHSADRVGFLNRRFNIPYETGWDLLNNEYAYQFVCRISLREMPAACLDVRKKKIIVMGKPMATYLQSKFPGSTVHRFESERIEALNIPVRGRKLSGTKALTGAERTRKCRQNRKAIDLDRKLEILKSTNETSRILVEPSDSKKAEICNEITLIESIDGGVVWSIAICGKKDGPIVSTATANSFDEVVEFLKNQSQRQLRSKTANQLFNMTVFKPDERGLIAKRRLTDVVHSHAILMDMDSDKNCDPDAFAGFMSGIQFVCYSSFTSSIERRRWRAVIPLSRPVTVDEYRTIADDLLEICDQNGFTFDNKKAANDIMYLPCVGANPEACFFKNYGGQGRGFLDVDRWLSAS